MMKKLLLWLTAFVVSAMPVYASEAGAGQVKLQQETDKLSLLLLLNEWEKALPQTASDRLENHLYQAMKAQPAANERQSAARKNAEPEFAAELRKIYEARLRELHPEKPDWTLPAELEKDLEASLQRVQKKYFASCFQAARKRLVAEQKELVFRQIYPSLEELEKWSDAELAKQLQARFQAGLDAPLWEENAAILGKEILTPAIQSGRRQQKMQLELAQTLPVPPELWDAAPIAEHLQKEVLQKTASALSPQEKPYALFAATHSAIQTRAQSIPAERFIAALPENLPQAEYRKKLETHPEKHVSLTQSQETVRADFTRHLAEAGMKKCAMPPEFAAKLQNDKTFQRRLQTEFEKRFAALSAIRQEFAERQLSSYWADLSSGAWRPELTETEQYAATGSQTVPTLRAMPEKDDFLLDETKALRNEKIRAILAQEVARLESQQSCIIEIYAQVLAAMSAKQQSLNADRNLFLELFFPEESIDLDTVRDAYQKMVLEQCPAPLFPSAIEEIEVRSRAILSAVITPAPAPKKTPSTPEEPLPEVEIPVLLTGEGERVTIAVGEWRKTCSQSAISADEVAGALRGEMEKSGDAAKFRITLWVQGKTLYYHTVAELQAALEKALDCPIDDAIRP